MGPTHRLPTFAVLMLAAAGAGCAAEAPSLTAALPPPGETAATPAGAAAQGPSLGTFLMPQDLVVGTPTEVYTRVARGVLTCWFGAAGPLKAQYIYHASAEPASKGGSSEIKIMTRDADAEDPRALRAYRIAISPSHDKTKVELENVRLPEPLAARLKVDVERWSRDEPGCGEGPVTGGWGAEPVAEAKPEKKAPQKKKKP